jgi:hypothetical protein
LGSAASWGVSDVSTDILRRLVSILGTKKSLLAALSIIIADRRPVLFFRAIGEVARIKTNGQARPSGIILNTGFKRASEDTEGKRDLMGR